MRCKRDRTIEMLDSKVSKTICQQGLRRWKWQRRKENRKSSRRKAKRYMRHQKLVASLNQVPMLARDLSKISTIQRQQIVTENKMLQIKFFCRTTASKRITRVLRLPFLIKSCPESQILATYKETVLSLDPWYKSFPSKKSYPIASNQNLRNRVHQLTPPIN